MTADTASLLQNLPIEVDIPELLSEPGGRGEKEDMSLTELMQDSFVFHHNGRKRVKSLDESDTVTTFASSSFGASFRDSQHERSPSPTRRRVRFSLDADDEPYCEEFESAGPITEEEKLSMWWQPMEFKLFRRYCKRSADIARKSGYAENFQQVYAACAKGHVDDAAEMGSTISRISVRGLEAVTFPTLVQARRLVVKGVVNTQRKLDRNMSYEERAKVLRASSRCLTGRAKLLARILGAGDEEVAKDCYYSMDHKTEEVLTRVYRC